MALNRCESGHLFDRAKYSACPTCGVRDELRPRRDVPSGPGAAAADADRTRRRDEPPAAAGAPGAATPAAADDAKTQRLIRRMTGVDPVVGWLVCVKGPERGHDYRLHSEKNFVGRGDGMDVRIAGDGAISRENHAVVSFDPKKETFRLLPGDGRGLVYLNGEEVITPTALAAGDRIELGESELMFVPLCDGRFSWSAAADGDAA